METHSKHKVTIFTFCFVPKNECPSNSKLRNHPRTSSNGDMTLVFIQKWSRLTIIKSLSIRHSFFASFKCASKSLQMCREYISNFTIMQFIKFLHNSILLLLIIITPAAPNSRINNKILAHGRSFSSNHNIEK